MPRKEELNEEYLKRRVKETGGATRKCKWLARRGAPDRFCGWPEHGRSAFVEVKEKDQPWGLQDHQRRELAWLRDVGQRTAVLETKDDIDNFVRWMTKTA